jgi:hypothetical protein
MHVLSPEAHSTFNRLKKIAINTNNVCDVEIDYDPKQYPEFEDSSIISATWKDSKKELTDDELDTLNEDSDFVYESVQDIIY